MERSAAIALAFLASARTLAQPDKRITIALLGAKWCFYSVHFSSSFSGPVLS